MIEFISIGSIVIDDIVDAGGRSNMGVLGGGGSHAAAGMRVWSENVALASVIGQGFPAQAWDSLQTMADTRGIVRRKVSQPRAWQLFEADGTRHEVFRTDFDTFRQIPIRPDEYPAELAPACGVYLQTATAAEAIAWAERLRQLNPTTVLLWEPWEIIYTPENLAGFAEAAAWFDVVSPNTTEVSWMLRETDSVKQAEMLLAHGVRCVALRMGAAGSLVGRRGDLRTIPAVNVPVVDETGAGNSYCGGFLVGYVRSGGEALTAGRYGAVSATFALAQLGLARLRPDARSVAEQRLAELSQQA